MKQTIKRTIAVVVTLSEMVILVTFWHQEKAELPIEVTSIGTSKAVSALPIAY